MSDIISTIANIVWGVPVIVLIMGTGVLLTVRTKGLQFTKLFYALKLAFWEKSDKTSQGDISNFQSLMVALAATVGTGNIVGVATAIVLGGPEALAWMWLSALVGMVTKYAEAVLAVKYRVTDEKGNMSGGPMYYLEKGLHLRKLGLAFALFAIFASFGIGSGVQTNSIAEALKAAFNVPETVTGAVIFVGVAAVILGGVKCIGRVSSVFVPAMIVFYMGASLYVICTHFSMIPQVFAMIVKGAFSAEAFAGGMAGAAIRYGVARGIFSNEAGLGSAPIAAAAAKTDHPCRQALVSMTQTFLDTIVICSMTGFILLVGGEYGKDLSGAALTAATFQKVMGPCGAYIVAISLTTFAFSTVLGWSYYGERSAYYLFGQKGVLPYKCVFITFAVLGAVTKDLNLVWDLSDIFNALMAIPNLIGIIGLSGVVAAETNAFLKVVKAEKEAKKAA